jgi:carbon-monoxide dehydrogenase large subunit
VQFGMGTYGSRSGPVGMGAVWKALDKIEAKAKKIAGHLMEADPGDIVIENGELKVAGTDKKLAWHEVTLAAYTAHNLPDDVEPGLAEKSFYDPTNFTFPSGCFICEVEIDPDTGRTEIVNFVAVDDFGVIVNPLVVHGQVHGGLAQGIGQALLEACVYDEAGQLVTASYMDYCVPRADDLPSFLLDHVETPNPSNPIGVKGCGEAGAIGSPAAVINAITDALGTEDITMPATPEKVWRAIQATRPAVAAE